MPRPETVCALQCVRVGPTLCGCVGCRGPRTLLELTAVRMCMVALVGQRSIR